LKERKPRSNALTIRKRLPIRANGLEARGKKLNDLPNTIILPGGSIVNLPIFWTVKGCFYGCRVKCLPNWYIAKALKWRGLRPDRRAALIAVSGFRVLKADQQEGR